MEIQKKSEVIEEEMLEEYGEDLSIVSIRSKALAKYIKSKADVIDEIDEDDVEDFKIAVDGAMTILVFNGPYSNCENFECFFETIKQHICDCGIDEDDFDDWFSDFYDCVNDDDIEEIDWHYRNRLDRHCFDTVADRYFAEAKKQYMTDNNIEESAFDDVSDEDVRNFVYGSNVAYVTIGFVYNKELGEDKVFIKTFELL